MEQPPLPDATASTAREPAPAVLRRLSVEELGAIALGKGADLLPVIPLYFQVSGRISRRTFWLHGVLSLLVVAVVFNALLDIAGLASDISSKLVNLLLAWPYIAVSGKRLHDYNRSAWWMLINLVPVVGWFVTLLANGFMRGRSGPNRFGADPNEFRASHVLNTGR